MATSNDMNSNIDSSPFLLPRSRTLKWIAPVIENMTGLKRLHNHYLARPTNASTESFLTHTLDALGISYQTHKLDRDNIPESGPLLIVANHPLGGVEGVILAKILLEFRPDLLVMANHFLKRIPELSSLFIVVDVFEGNESMKAILKAIKQAHKHLANQGALLIFPAGEVSTYDNETNQLQDKEWNRLVGKLAQKHKANCLPIFIGGKNSKSFYLAGRLHPRFRTLLLGRELLNKKGTEIPIFGGNLISSSEFAKLDNADDITNYLRLNTYLVGQSNQTTEQPLNALENPLEIESDISASILEQTIETLPSDSLLVEQKQFSVYISNAQNMGPILQQIGIMRERNFRVVGEGTGKSIDLDEFDQDYMHLFIWDHDAKVIAGAYRLGLVDKIMDKKGIKGLYSRTLFDFDNNFLQLQGKSIEMGRSVIDAPYQRSLSALLLLWKGIGTFVSRNPSYQTLFGPVSISGEYQTLTHQLIVQCLTTHYYDLESAKLVKATNPLLPSKKPFWSLSLLSGLGDRQLLSNLVSRLEKGKGLPVLIRQYLALKGRFVSFNVDPDFNQTVDGLILVNLPDVPLRMLSKYMGSEQAQSYLSHNEKSEQSR
jgi:putative hemolysin